MGSPFCTRWTPQLASITQQKNGWRAQVYVSGERDSKVFRTQREAKAWASTREIELRTRKTTPAAELHTVGEMLKRYGEEISPQKRGERAEQLRITALVRDFPDLASMRLSEVRTPHLAAWRDARLKGFDGPDGKPVDKVTPASVQRDINWLRNAFNVAREEWHWMDHKPFEGFRMPADTPPRTRRVDPWKEVRPIVRSLGYRSGHAPVTRSQEVALAFLIGLRTAMRAGEILSLGSKTLNLQRRVATVHHKMEYLTGRPREVPLSRHAVRLLRPIAEREQCFEVSSGTLDAIFRKARDKLLIDDLHFHDSRAEALTRLSRKVDVMTLAKISGHKDLRILQQVYYRESSEDIAARL
jgi:integrase